MEACLKRIKEILIAFDQFCNSLLFFLPGEAFADETLSARAWRCRETQPYTTLRAVIDGLFFWQVAHCESSYTSEKLRMQSPPEERQE